MTAQPDLLPGAGAGPTATSLPPAPRRTAWGWVVGATAAALVAALAVAAAAWLDPQPEAPSQPSRPHLPTAVNAPGAWSDQEGPDGPLAALGISIRTVPEGLAEERREEHLFGVSADDGRAMWIDLPGVDVGQRGFVGWFALSPDGRRLAWSRSAGRRDRWPGSLAGWSVMDTTSGKIREISDPEAPLLRSTASDLAFSGDSRYLLTSYERAGARGPNRHQFVAWDVADGTPTVLEEPGQHWLPTLGSAPSGVVWSRGRTVHRHDPSTGQRASYVLPQSLDVASWGPDDRAFAYVGSDPDRRHAPRRLYAGRSLAQARDRVVPLEVEPGQILGWRDDTHVVVGHHRTSVQVVDITTGEVDVLDLAGDGETINPPLLASALWGNTLSEPVAREGTSDPRRPLRWGVGVLLTLVLAGIALRARRDLRRVSATGS